MKSFLELDTTKEDGFTLVEILITIAIIGVLAAIAVPVFLNQREKSKKATLQSDLHSVRLAYDSCKAQQGESVAYPDTYYNWSNKTTFTTCGEDLKLSEGTRIHAFDMAAYYYAVEPKLGKIYCIESGAGNYGLWYRSDKGIASETVRCQDQ